MRAVPVLVGALLVCSGAGAQFVAPGGVIPVVANLPGLNDTVWRSDVSVLNVSDVETTIRLQLFPEIIGGAAAFEPVVSDPITVPAGGQVTLTNVVQSLFQLRDTKGAVWVLSTAGEPLVLASRTYTVADGGGSFGQDVTSVLVASPAWAAGLRHDSFYRTNLGIFWPWDQTVQFQVSVRDGGGQEVGSGVVVFEQAGLQQVSLGAFGVEQLVDGFVVLTCPDAGAVWYAYASRVDQITGDAVFRVARGYQPLG
jgi:hypothetical protein